MSTLSTLIKIHQQELEELSYKINELENSKIALEQEAEILMANFEQENQEFANNIEFAVLLSSYREKVRKKHYIYQEKLLSISNEILELRDNLIDSFASVKKFETVLERRINARNKAEEDKIERDINDMNILRYKK